MIVDIVTRGKGRPTAARRLRGKAVRILRILRRDRAELSLALVGNREIRRLNRRYRNKDEPTDVLSFPAGSDLSQREPILGDVVISMEKARSQAREHRRPLDAELETLLIHGILHLLGYDHEISAQEARRMGRMEKKIQRALCESGK